MLFEKLFGTIFLHLHENTNIDINFRKAIKIIYSTFFTYYKGVTGFD